MKKYNLLFVNLMVILTVVVLTLGSCKKDETPNNLPIVSSVSVNPGSVEEGGLALVTVMATDTDEDELTYTYTVTGGSISGIGSAVEWTAPSTEGVYNVSVVVSDGKDETTSSGTLIVEAPQNSLPVISDVQVNPSSVEAGSTATITVTASDADGDQLSYQYQVTGGAVSGSGSTVTWTTPSQGGAYSVTVTVNDGNGGESTGTGSITVEEAATQINGTASFPAGYSGDLSNAKVSIYTSYDNWAYNIPLAYTAATGTGSSVSFSLTDIPAGIYYLDVWKDNDNSGDWSLGDFVGWYGDGGLGGPSLTEISIQDGQTKEITVSMIVISGKTNIPKSN